MKPGIVYTGGFIDLQAVNNTTNALAQRDHLINIYDYGTLIDDALVETFVTLELAEVPLSSSTIDNSEDKFEKPIIGTTVNIQVHTSDEINLNTFSTASDNRYLLKWYVAGQLFYQGYLVQDEMSQEFLPDPNLLELTFSDNLGILSDKPLINLINNPPRGQQRIIDYFIWALYQTGMDLAVNVICNLREQNSAPVLFSEAGFTAGTNLITVVSTEFPLIGKRFRVSGTVSNNGTFTILGRSTSIGLDFIAVTPGLTTETATNVTFTDLKPHAFDTIYIDAKTFEDEIGECEDCYTVLEKILTSFGCRLFQHWGAWYIVSVDEMDTLTYYSAGFQSTGSFSDYETVNYVKSIGDEETIHFSNDDARVISERPHKEVVVNYELEFPKEMPCNSEFIRGNPTSSFTLAGHTVYNLDCWTLRRGVGASLTTPNCSAGIARTFDSVNRETARYAVLTSQAVSGGQPNYIISEPIYISQKDKFELSFDYSALLDNNTPGSTSIDLAIFALYGDDGSVWLLGDNSGTNPGSWKLSNADFTVNRDQIEWTFNASTQDMTDWLSFSITSPPAPTDGNLYILLYGANQVSGASDDFTIRFNNLTFNYLPYIDGTYKPMRAIEHKVRTARTANAKKEHQVYLSDAPRKAHKGALFKKDGSTYILTELWYKAHIVRPPSVPATTDLKPLTEWVTWAVWNQYRLSRRSFEFNAQGLDTNLLYVFTVNPMGLVHKYYLTDANPNTNNRIFTLLHFNADWHLGEWEGYLTEVMNTAEGKTYTDQYTFRYLTE